MAIPAIDLDFTCVLEHEDHGLQFLGPTLRGALGFALKRTVCTVAHGECGRCPLQSRCAFPAIFDGYAPPDRPMLRKYPAIPQPFVLRVAPPDAWSGQPRELLFGITLFGDARHLWPYLVDVFQRIGRRGVGRRRTRYRLVAVQDAANGRLVHQDGSDELGMPVERRIGPHEEIGTETLRVRFVTPVSLRRDRTRLSDPGPLDIILAARRRWEILHAFYGEGDLRHEHAHVQAEDFEIIEADLEPWSIVRFSGRQQRRIELAGVRGHLAARGPWGADAALLRCLSHLHLGKHTSFGLGRIEIEEVSE